MTATPSCCGRARRRRRRARRSPSSCATCNAPRSPRCARASRRDRRARRRCRTSATRSSAETVSGLARVVRSNLLAGLQDVALWHERDISHSSVERIVLPDSTLLVHYMLHRLNRLLARARRRRRHACATTCGRATVWCSVSRCCSRSWRRASTRDDAYRIVQRNALQSWEERRDFRSLLESDPDVGLDAATLDSAFDLDRALGHQGRVFEALDQVV